MEKSNSLQPEYYFTGISLALTYPTNSYLLLI